MNHISKILGIIIGVVIIAIQIPEIIGSFVYETYKPDQDINMKMEILEGWERMVSITQDGKFLVVEKNDSMYVLQSHKYSAQKAFHIGPFFDNRMGGRYRILGSTIRPNVSEVVEIRIKDYPGKTLVNNQTIEVDSEYDGKTTRLIVYKDGHFKLFKQYWIPVDSHEMMDALFNAYAKGVIDE